MVAQQTNNTLKHYGALARRLFVGCAALIAVAACGSDPAGPRPTTYSSVTSADFMTCDLASGGVAWCWGELRGGGSTTLELEPVLVNTTVRFTQLSAYSAHVCGLTSDGDAYCWGPNTDGMLGVGTFDNGRAVPTAVVGDIKFKSISAGGSHTCGVSRTGVGYCWGLNVDAQGGHSEKPDVAVPTVVQGGHTWASISAGTVASCGITTAGAGYCWGSDTYGTLGDGGTISGSSLDTSAAPVPIAGGRTWKQISVGQYHACGLTTAGAAYCWGYNDYRLGNNDNTSRNESAPVAVVGGLVFKSIDAGRYTTCAITTGDLAYCWGANLAGQFGVEDPIDLERFPVLAVGGRTVSEINTGSGETTCAISLDRQTVWCFGLNNYGQTGSGGQNPAPTHNWQPRVVVGQHPAQP